MRTPQRLLRILLLAGLCQMAAACAMNPFDGDPNGPPPAPRMMSGAYGGESGDPYAGERSRPDPESEARPRREARLPQNDYGTSSIDERPLPPPVESAALEPLPPPVDAETRRAQRNDRREAPRDGARNEPADLPPPVERTERPSGERVLSTRKGRAETPDAKPQPPAEEARAPKPATATHRVRGGEELADIADTYDVREVEIIALNKLRPPYELKAGQELKIPVKAGARAAPPESGDYVVAGADVVVPSPKPSIAGRKTAATEEPGDAEPASVRPSPSSSSNLVFDWPVSGKVISGFGASGDGLYNEGINIAVPAGTPVRASAPGVVRYAGNELEGYGNLILIEHAGGFVTAYAHNQTLTVKRGQKVERGAVIARSGQTGNVKTPQLHFEIREGTKSVDPRKLLVAMN
jgi:murein DD-endopeptidase MepM/ murein hydrolase activator NlpD